MRLIMGLTLSQTTNYRLSKLKEKADDYFKSDENSKFSKRVEITGKKTNCSLQAISPFPRVFSKDLHSRHLKKKFVWKRINLAE